MNEIASYSQTIPAPPPEIVPAEIVLPTPPRIRPRRIMRLFAMPGLWLFPKTFGAHVAAGPLSTAVAACVLGVCMEFFILILSLAVNLPEDVAHPELPLVEKCRVVAARFALDAAENTGTAVEAIVAMTAFAFGRVGVAILIWLAMPVWIAAGDATRLVFRRSLRLGFWLPTTGVPIALFAAFGTPWIARLPGLNHDVATGITIALGSIYFLWVALRAGLRYAGPAVGPGFDPIEPHCTECGYALQGLPTTGRCPECGEPTERSLARYIEPPSRPPLRRRWARRIAAVPRVVFWPKATFRALRVQFDAPEARAFWVMNTAAISVVCLMCALLPDLWQTSRFDWESLSVTIISILAIGVGSQAIVATICTLGALLRRGERRMDVRIATVALGYASAMLWPAAVWMLAVLITFNVLNDINLGEQRFTVPYIEWGTSVSDAIWLGSTVVLVVLLGLWGLWIDKGYRNLRHTSG